MLKRLAIPVLALVCFLFSTQSAFACGGLVLILSGAEIAGQPLQLPLSGEAPARPCLGTRHKGSGMACAAGWLRQPAGWRCRRTAPGRILCAGGDLEPFCLVCDARGLVRDLELVVRRSDRSTSERALVGDDGGHD